MNCNRAQTLLSAYIDRELSGAEMLSVREHVSRCTACQFEAQRLAGVKEALQAMKAVAPPAGLEDRLMRAVERSSRPAVGRYAFAGLLVASSVLAVALALHLSAPSAPAVKSPIATKDHREFQVSANDAYIGGSDSLGGGVPAVTVGYAGGH